MKGLSLCVTLLKRYEIVAAPEAYGVLTEGGDQILTESGDALEYEH